METFKYPLYYLYNDMIEVEKEIKLKKPNNQPEILFPKQLFEAVWGEAKEEIPVRIVFVSPDEIRILRKKKPEEELVRADQLADLKKHGITEDEAKHITKKSSENVEKAETAIEAAEEMLMQLIQAKAKAGEVCEVEDDIRLLLRKAKQFLRGEN